MNERQSRLLLLLIIVFAVGAIVGVSVKTKGLLTGTPETHQWILDHLEVTDQRWPDTALDEKLVDYGIRTYGKALTTLGVFQIDEDYYQTTWLIQRHGDTELCLTIWGPGDDGKTHCVEVAQLGYGPFKVYVNGEERLFLYQEGQNTADPGAHMVGWFNVVIES